MPDAAIAKVEDAFAALITAATATGQPLAGWTVVAGQNVDEAIDETLWPAIAIYTTSIRADLFEEINDHLHTATIEFEVISAKSALGTISRRNQNAIAALHGVVAADRYLGGRLQSCEEVDVAPATPNGKDVGSASLQYEVQFLTPRSDWFTIIGQGGATF